MDIILDDERLERVLLKNKFRMEKVKAKLDNYYTLRGMYPEFTFIVDKDYLNEINKIMYVID